MVIQKELPQQMMATYPLVSKKLKEELFDPNNKRCPFYGYVGNEEAVRLIMRIASRAFESLFNMSKGNPPVWSCLRDYPIRMLLTGPRSVGKTTFAKKYASLIGTNYDTGIITMPFAEIDAAAVSRREEVLEKITQAMRAVNLPLVPTRVVGQVRHYTIPPMVIFIDEVHRLSKKVIEGLLKMTEPNDGLFEVGNNRVDCKRAAIVCATTDPGKLLATFKSRFPIKITLKKHTLEEVGTIIQHATNWSREDAMKLARMKPIPREALEIARLIQDTRGNSPVSKFIDVVAVDLGLSEDGLSQRAIDVLMALAETNGVGMSKKNICALLDNMDETEFEADILPQLMKNEFHPSLVTISSRHKITEAGLTELRVRRLIDY